MKILKGLGAAEGIAFAKAFVLKTNKFSGNRTSITEDKIPLEIEALKTALAKAKDEVALLQKKAYSDGASEQGDVFGAYRPHLSQRRCSRSRKPYFPRGDYLPGRRNSYAFRHFV